MPELALRAIAHIENDLTTKFGLPRQSGLVESLRGRIVFEPEYRRPEALRGLEGFTHIWLIWGFSANRERSWTPTVRPPRLGGNARMGVFATRSPYRPNPVGLSCVKLESIDVDDPDGPVLNISGADLMSGTPIYDIKPYLPYADAHPEASGGFTDNSERRKLDVNCPPELMQRVPEASREALLGVLAHDPRPAYQHDPERTYGLDYAGLDVRFTVDGDELTVSEISAKRPVTEVVAALIRKGDRFMICQRPAHKARALLWEFVGGKLEPGETREQALVRECREELDVSVMPNELFMEVLHEYPDLTVRLSLYTATLTDGEPKLIEHNDIRWISIDEIPQYDFCPADEEILARLMSSGL